MKTIELNTAAVDNAGRRLEAGERVAVGTRPTQIDIDRAKELVGRASATALRETKPAATVAKGNVKKAATKPKAVLADVPPQVAASTVSADIAKP